MIPSFGKKTKTDLGRGCWKIFCLIITLIRLSVMQAFYKLFNETGLTAEQLLAPEENATLLNILSYHVVPDVSANAAELTEGMMLPTLIPEANLTVGP